MKPKYKIVNKIWFFPSWIAAVTLYPYIFIKKEYKDDKCIRAHEEYHFNQIQKFGIIPWYLLYLVLLLVYIGKPTNRHPLEKKAYEIQYKCINGEKSW